MNIMKPAVAICLLTACPSLWAAPPSADQARLVKLELELCLKKARGLGDNHPAVRRVATGIEIIETKTPGVRDADYRKLVEKNRAKLEDELIRLADAGYGDRHPQCVEITAQLNGMERRLAAPE